MPSIDNRVVEMRFENAKFERGIKTSTDSLSRLKESLNFDKQSASLKQFERYSNSLNFSALQNGIDAIKYRFSSLGIAGAEVIRTLTNEAMYLGSRIMNSIAAPMAEVNYLMKEGGKQRALNVEQAKFIMEGLKLDFNKFNDDINNAVNGTRFGYDEAAMAASQLAASGVTAAKKLSKSGKEISYMGEALLAISGAAAMTNSEYADMANIFTTVASNGRLMTEQVRSFSYRGLNITADLAKQFGKTESQMADMISKGKVDFKMFSEAMYNLYGKQATKADEMLTGVTANIRAAWKKIGQDFWTPVVANNGPIVKGLQKFKDLVNNTIRPAVRSLFEVDGKEFLKDNTWMRLVNNVGKAMQKVFTDEYTLNFVERTIKSVHGLVDGVMQTANAVVTSEHTANIIKNTIDGVKQSFEAIISFVRPFTDILANVFKEFIPEVSLERLDELSEKFYAFSQYLQALAGVKFKSGHIAEVADEIDAASESFIIFQRIWGGAIAVFKNTVRSAMAIFDIFKQVFSALARVISPSMADPILDIGDQFVSLSDTVASFFEKLAKALKGSDAFYEWFKSAADFLAPAVNFIVDNLKSLMDAINTLASWGSDALAKFIKKFTVVFLKPTEEISNTNSPLPNFVDMLLGKLDQLKESLSFITNIFGPALDKMKGRIEEAMGRVAKALNLDNILGIIKGVGIGTALAGIYAIIDKYKGKILGLLVRAVSPVQKVSTMISTVIDNFSKKMQDETKNAAVERLKTLAEAILMIAAAMFVLSLIPAEDLDVAVMAISTALTELGAMMKYLNSLDGKAKDGDGNKFATWMISIAASMLILSFALKKISDIDSESLARGILGIGFLLTELGAFMKMVKFDKDTKLPTGSLILLAISVRILAGALKSVGELDNEGAARGIMGLGAIFAALILFTKYANNAEGLTKTSFALILLSVSVRILASAVRSMGNLDNESLARGIFGIYNLMLAMGLFTKYAKNPKGFMKTAFALVILAAAVRLMTSSVLSLANLDNEGLARGLIGVYALMFAMGIFANKVEKSKGLTRAAIAMVILSAAMNSFAKIIGTLGAMDNESLARGLFGLGVALLEIGIAMHYLSKDKMKLGTIAGLLAMTVFINSLAGALANMALIDPEGMAVALLGLSVALAAIVIAMNALSGDAIFGGLTSLGKGAAFLMMGIGINFLADALSKLAAINPEQMALALFGLCVSLAAMAAASLVASGPMLALGAAVALFGGGIGALAWGLAKLSVALIPLAAVIVAAGPEIVQFLKDLVVGFVEVLPKLVRGLVEAVGEFFVALVEKADEIADAVGELILTVLRKLKEIIPELIAVIAEILAEIWKYIGPAVSAIFPWLLEKIAAGWEWIKANFFPMLGGLLDWVWGMLMGFFGWILQGVINFVSAVNGFFSGLFSFIWEIVQGMWNAGVEFVSNIISGINEKVTEATEAIGQLIQDMVDGVTGFWQDFYDAGANLVQGVIDGIGSLWDTAVNAFKGLGSTMWQKFTEFWDEHSPSRRSKWGAEMIVRGIVRGINDYSHLAVNSVKSLNDDMWDSMQWVNNTIVDALNSDLDPTITPVLDLSNIQNGAGAINGMFGSTSFSLASANEAALENQRLAALNKIEAATTNADVVAALGLLRGDVNSLNDAFSNTQVVLDSGALVGATARKMDNALGKINTYRRRGI